MNIEEIIEELGEPIIAWDTISDEDFEKCRKIYFTKDELEGSALNQSYFVSILLFLIGIPF